MDLITTTTAFEIIRAGGRATRKDFYQYWHEGQALWEIKLLGDEFTIVGPDGPIKPIRIADPDNPPSMEDVMNSVAIWMAADSFDFVEIK